MAHEEHRETKKSGRLPRSTTNWNVHQDHVKWKVNRKMTEEPEFKDCKNSRNSSYKWLWNKWNVKIKNFFWIFSGQAKPHKRRNQNGWILIKPYSIP